MIGNPEFQQRPKNFWAYVRTLSQHLGYTVRSKGVIKVPTLSGMGIGLSDLGLDPAKVVTGSGSPTPLGEDLDRYFHYRAAVLNDNVQHQLMDVENARHLFCPGSAGNGEGAFSVSEYAALRAGIFKASGSTDPIKLGKGAEPCSAAPVASSR